MNLTIGFRYWTHTNKQHFISLITLDHYVIKTAHVRSFWTPTRPDCSTYNISYLHFHASAIWSIETDEVRYSFVLRVLLQSKISAWKVTIVLKARRPA